MTPILLLSTGALASAIACIVADEHGRRGVVYLCKPLTMLCILAMALAAPAATAPLVRQLVLIGLVFSLGGDILLMLPGDRFIAGLGSFLVAHLFYIAAFASEVTAPAWGALACFSLVAGGFYRLLLPHLRGLRIPVAVYSAAIAAMAWLAMARALESDAPGVGLACAGASLFVVSDAALAWNRFHTPLPCSACWVLGTYFPAQWLIALSLGGGSALGW